MNIEESAAVLASLLAFGLVTSAVRAALRVRQVRDEIIKTSLEQRLADLGDLMKSSAQVLEEVQSEIQARIALAEKAKVDAEEAERLAGLNEAQRLALTRLVRAELAAEVGRAGRKSLLQGVLINFLFFAAGVASTLLIGR